MASLAPVGREGLFFALLSLKSLLVTVPSNVFNGWLNQEFNPNCPSCRDAHGHYCDVQPVAGVSQAQRRGSNARSRTQAYSRVPPPLTRLSWTPTAAGMGMQ